MKIYLIRHGQTDWNKERRVQGRSGLPLNAEGIKQAEATAKKLKGLDFEIVLSSPQMRAVQTAKIASGIEPIIDERINVFDLGTADGLKIDEVKTAKGGLVPDPSIYEGVESVSDYMKRIKNFMDELVATFGNRDVNVLVCGHKCTTGAISAYIEGMPEDGNFLKLAAANGEFKVLEYPQKNLQIPAGNQKQSS